MCLLNNASVTTYKKIKNDTRGESTLDKCFTINLKLLTITSYSQNKNLKSYHQDELTKTYLNVQHETCLVNVPVRIIRIQPRDDINCVHL